MHPAVFLDRDGTLIEDRGHLRDPSEVIFFPDTVRALRLLQQRFLLFIVTHQPGIAQAILRHEEVENVNRAVVERLAQADIRIEEVYCCPHARLENCVCIKPNPHHLHLAARKFSVDLGRSFVIGDHPHDVDLARNAGAAGLYVLTGHGEKHRAELSPDAIVTAGIWDAALLAGTLGGGAKPASRSGS